ncbi:MAG: hypothetical protein ACLPT4_04290 [Verrucomicrobiia bacterium]
MISVCCYCNVSLNAWRKIDPDARAILENIIGGILVSALTLLYVWLRTRFTRFHLHRVLGATLSKDATLTIAYGQLNLPPIVANGVPITHPYVKQVRTGGPPPLVGSYSIEHPVSENEVRASTYLAQLFGQARVPDIKLLPDTAAIESNEGNFVSLGGPGSNYKTADILACANNIFIRMEHDHFALVTGTRLPYQATSEHDYGFILRVRSPFFPLCALTVCAGLGEWGTSGSAWFLSRKWRDLMKYGDSWRTLWGLRRQADFLAIIKVIRRQDDSGSIVAYYRGNRGRIVQIK